MPEFKEPIQEVYQPVFNVAENLSPDIATKKIGQKIKAIINYTVIEKTKNYLVVRINTMNLAPEKRIY